VNLSQLNLTKLKLEYLKVWLEVQKKENITQTKLFCISRVRLFSGLAQESLLLQYGHLSPWGCP